MIRYPGDAEIYGQAREKAIPAPVLIRDLVRVVEVLNLKAKQFFGPKSVLAGSMALRCFGSPRFTVFDADFSTTSATVHPYDLDIWLADEAPTVFVMSPHEIMAEKILGWCADRQVKHYADLGFIAVVSNPQARIRAIDIDYKQARDVLDAKLKIMTGVHPAKSARFPTIDSLIDDLAQPPSFDAADWRKIMYIRDHRDRFTQSFIQRAVQGIMVPGLRSSNRAH